MKHFLLFYETSDDYLQRRAQFREAHLRKAWESCQRNELILGGALEDPKDGAVLLFRADSKDVVEEFAKADPYVQNGLVKSWRVHEWKTVVGEMAAHPIRSA
jgi:uncharacterized protein YciI